MYPGWVPVAGDRALRRAKFVPSPYAPKEPDAIDSALAASGDAGATSEGADPAVTEASPAAGVFEALLPDVGAGPPPDAPPTPEPPADVVSN
jgi:hypothetical protein